MRFYIKNQLEILENKFSKIKGGRFPISKSSKDKLLQPLKSKMKMRWNNAKRTLHDFYAKNEK
jgi:hypothetical protein